MATPTPTCTLRSARMLPRPVECPPHQGTQHPQPQPVGVSRRGMRKGAVCVQEELLLECWNARLRGAQECRPCLQRCAHAAVMTVFLPQHITPCCYCETTTGVGSTYASSTHMLSSQPALTSRFCLSSSRSRCADSCSAASSSSIMPLPPPAAAPYSSSSSPPSTSVCR